MTAPAWARGYPLEQLRPVTAAFKEHEQGRVFGAFSRVNDAWVADRLSAGHLLAGERCYASAAPVGRDRIWQAFGGVGAARLEKGALLVERAAGDLEELAEMLAPKRLAGWLAWLPDDAVEAAAEKLGLQFVGAQVTSAGEVRGLWAALPTGDETPPRLHKGLARLPLTVDPGPLLDQIREAAPQLAPHYSTYNKRRSWSAASLRGFGGVQFIEKPAEMSKSWKQAHPGWERMRCEDTELRAQLPAVEKYLDVIGRPPVERVRLMALAPGGGELTRHADSTDHDAGLADGRLCRLHFPLVTNPGVVFTTWGLDGRPRRAHMAAGEGWLLDHAKPHAAVNGGQAMRLHLVIDAWVYPELGELLDAAA
jgi:Aspartyl/Asparaginyl beta-hydroxylase